ncbi:MAG: phytanoyl-CoA dioxygenase family protein [Polynucleobacter sp.]|nr:phytanoyl-CoA dioxygenase family protein [Polynucleobacter sp.]
MQKIQSQIREACLNRFYEQGYFITPEPDMIEQSWLVNFLSEKWRNQLIEGYPSLDSVVRETEIGNYHEMSHQLDHSSFWTKQRRIFSEIEISQLLKHVSVFEELLEVFGDYEVADLEGIGYPEIYWRLVRPSCPEDVASPHKDSWFWTVTNKIASERQSNLIKVWLPVVTIPSESGLSISPSSHKKEIPFTSETRHGRSKPTVNQADIAAFEMVKLPLVTGQAVVFHRDLLHQGIAHVLPITRVSVEFAIETKNKYD